MHTISSGMGGYRLLLPADERPVGGREPDFDPDVGVLLLVGERPLPEGTLVGVDLPDEARELVAERGGVPKE